MSDSQENIEKEILGSDYGPGALEEPGTYRPDKGDDDPGLSSTLAAGTDTEQLRDGGPPPEHGVMTTTGGNAGPNSFRAQPRSGPGVANTTTGDATTGAMQTPVDSYTSDSSSNAVD
ncbi:hypothetical protein [Paractinoplanes brasiliensis]|uniref:Uncharacterized protein n=1 Tax=Paractinoplanes brasiliensis TaxID=52695 RepID=A0A4R6K106_9ACTN|nr:hypothetical protein [Actinoplanes brasiliensis]TDO40845.1 hypothetical protein C8E87_4564 [Actinoplanes brasiliensis]GID25913.1 hypothetical protein Abr02nite_08960 [Actinoplanes brasiliensis]